jgi:hypothetical protein
VLRQVAEHVLFVVLGFLLGLVGTFLVPDGVAIGVAAVGNLVAGRLGVIATGRVGGAVAAGGGWAVVAVAAMIQLPSGSLLIAGGVPGDRALGVFGLGYLAVGFAAALVAVATARSGFTFARSVPTSDG